MEQGRRWQSCVPAVTSCSLAHSQPFHWVRGQQANPRSHSPMKTVNPVCWDRVPLARDLGKAEPNSGWLCEVAFGDRKPEKAGHLMTFTHVGFYEEQQEESGSHNSGRISRNLVSSRWLLHQSQGVDFHRFS